MFRAAQDRLQAVAGNRNVRLAVPEDVHAKLAVCLLETFRGGSRGRSSFLDLFGRFP